jgi:urea transport system substrate-binding protein
MGEKDKQSFSGGERSLAGHSSRDLGETMDGGGDTTSDAATPPRSDPQAWVGRRIGKYEIMHVLGVGGMGVVLKGHDASIERDVAIKVLPAELSANQQALNRFLAEAKSAGKLNHPNAVTIYEIAQDGEHHFLVMEVVSGGSTEDHMEKSGAYSVSEATRIAIEACRGLAAAHKAGLVHRDIKPANLLLAEDGTVKVSDFGLAKRTQSQELQLTQAGQIVGTPYYMSPEQCESRDVDARSDVYSLGATYYGLLTGKSPYEASGSVVQVMYAHCNSPPPDPREINKHVPPACCQIIERAMAAKPQDRYQSMEEMATDLESVLAAISGAGILLPSQSGIRSMPPPSTAKNARGSSVTRRSLLVKGAAVVTLLGLISVGGLLLFGPNNGGQPKSSLPAIVPPAGEPIKVGVLHSLSGTMSDSESPVVDAVLLAIEELNREGGLLGRPVEAVVADGRSDSATFAREAERLILQEDVCTVFGCWTSASRKTVVPVFEEFDHLLVYPVQYEGIEESPNVFYTGATPNQQIIPAVKWAYAFEGKRRFFLVGSDYVFPRVAHEIIKDQLSELGADLAGEEFIALGSTDAQSVIEKIKQARPDVILNSINGDSNTAFFAELRKAGILPAEVPTISFSIGEEELRHLDVEAMTGDYAAWNYFQSIDSPENKEFISNFQMKYGPQRLMTDPMEAAYFGVKLWASAVRDAETTNTSDIRRSMRNQRLRAPEGDVRIDAATQHTFKTPRIGRVQNDGQFEIVWTAAKPQQPIPYPASRTTEQWRAYLHDLYTGWGDQWSAAPEE